MVMVFIEKDVENFNEKRRKLILNNKTRKVVPLSFGRFFNFDIQVFQLRA